jgi:hypothetical protein
VSARLSAEAEVWTCPDCNRTYRMPGGWEPAVWLSARRAAQYQHAARHGRPTDLPERRRRRDDPPPEEPEDDDTG